MDTLQQFIQYLQYEKKCSKHTIIAYEADIIQFANILSPPNISNFFAKEHIQKIQSLDIRNWLQSLHSKRLHPASIQRKIASIKNFFKYQLKIGNISHNPTKKLLSIKKPKRIPQFVPERDMTNLLENIQYPSKFEQLRNSLILEFLYASGLRRSELINIKITDLQLDKQLVKVVGKRNKTRIVPFNESTQNCILQYLEYCKKQGIELNSHLLVRKNGKPIYDQLVYRIVKNALLTFTKLQRNSPHILRHTFATHLLDRGAELDAVKEMLGHANLAATQVYTHNTLSKLKSVHKQAHPKSSLNL